MFFFKKKNPQDPAPISNENVAKKGIKTMDTVITGVILGGIIASLYGVKKLRTKDQKKDENETHDNHQ